MSIFEKIKKLFSKSKTEVIEEKPQESTIEEKASDYQIQSFNTQNLALGYIFKSLKNIEDSLSRIESNLASKEWLLLNLSTKEDVNKLLEKLAELNERILVKTGKMKNDIIDRIKEVVKEKKEISYEELAKELGISPSYLRYILSISEIPNVEKVIKGRKGFLVYKGESENSNITTQG